MTSSLVRLFALVVIASGCGGVVGDPTITLTTKATLEKRGSTWFFISPIATAPTANAARVQYAFRVRENSVGFMTTPTSRTLTFESPPGQLEIPLDARPQVAIGTRVSLTLEAMALSWDGVSDNGVTFKAQEYAFTFQ